MIRFAHLLCAVLLGTATFAQETDAPAPRTNKKVEISQTVQLRAIDRVSGRSETITVNAGQSVQVLDSVLYAVVVECRYYTQNPSGEAFAFLEIMDAAEAKPLFKGWMIASSPALNALEHNRYDLWPLRCITS